MTQRDKRRFAEMKERIEKEWQRAMELNKTAPCNTLLVRLEAVLSSLQTVEDNTQ